MSNYPINVYQGSVGGALLTDPYEYYAMSINKDNVEKGADGYYNILRYKWNKTVNIPRHSDITFSQGSVYYSWYNIDQSKYHNNQFSIRSAPLTNTSGSYMIMDLTIPDGMFNVPAINDFLHSQLVFHTWYYIHNPLPVSDPDFSKTNDSKYFPFDFILDEIALKVVLRANPWFNSADAATRNLRQPDTPTWAFPTNTQTGQFLFSIPAQKTLLTMLGFQPDTVNPNSTLFPRDNTGVPPAFNPEGIYEIESTEAPQIQPQTTILLGCSMVDNSRYSNATSSDIIYAFTPSVNPGDLQSLTSFEYQWNHITPRDYNEFILYLYDQNHVPLNITDPNTFIIVTIRIPKYL